MADNEFKNTVQTLFEGMEGFLQSKTVVGEAIHIGDTVVLPLVDVTFGVGAGANQGDKRNPNSGGGMGGKMSPTAMLVISNGTTKLVSVKNQDSIGKILDMVPDMVNKFTGKNSSDLEETLKDLESETE
ncbi:MAG: GerW family sporulation protein [Lachnospiraceae bacterium]|nr:GerW family sporulation protein [Lachnospiraceae bacterium]